MRIAVLCLVSIVSCSGKCGDSPSTQSDSAPASSASVTTAAVAGKDSGPAMKGCAFDAPPEVVDKAVRSDAGLTVVALADGKFAIGYAGPKGEPRVLVFGSDGKSEPAEVTSTLAPVVKPAERVVQRVTPIALDASAEAGLAMKVALDVMDVKEDKSTSFRCGPADGDALASTDSDATMKDCRTFSDGTRTFALESIVSGDTVRWLIDDKAGGPAGDDALLHEAKFTTEKLAQPARYLYQVPVAAFSAAGVLLASREDGGITIARRDAGLASAGKPARFWHGAPTTMPALALHEHDAVILFGLQGARDLYGAAFVLEVKEVPRPEKLALDDPHPPSEGDRASVTAAYFPKGDLLVGFADAKKARLAVLGADLKSLAPVSDLGVEVSELRAIPIADGKAVVTFIAKNQLQSATVTCSY
jgi:hypothetical protein